jgi:hypothetical protein
VSIRRRGYLIPFLFAALVILACAAPAVTAKQVLGRVDTWSPHRDVSTQGWTTVAASQNLGTGTDNNWGPSRKYRADNDRTVFRRQLQYGESDYPGSKRLTRNKFFDTLGDYSDHVDLRWKWRGPTGHRYRYITGITAILAG